MNNQDEFKDLVRNDIWVNYNKNKFEYDLINHAFGKKTFSFLIRHPQDDNPAWLSVYHDNYVTGMDVDNVNTAKQLVGSTIKHFEQNEDVKIEDIDDYLEVDKYIEQKIKQNKVIRKAAGTMSNVLKTGISAVVTHEKFGNITVDAGEAKSRSFGLNHIIKQRHDEGKSAKEITAMLILLNGTLKNGEKIRDIAFKSRPEHRGRMELESGGIIAVISKQRMQGDSEQWVLTGFEDKKNKEAADSVQKGISQYGYAPAFLCLEKQVGAVVSSLQISPELGEKSSSNIERQIKTARKAGYVQGVCECVAVIGDDHTLSKKLLTEMNVTKYMAQKYAYPETYKTLEQGIFAPKPEQKLEQTHSRKQ